MASWTLELAPAGTQRYTEFASGTSSITDGTLGVFDPTTLKNGPYTIRLTATDESGNWSRTTSLVMVDGRLKLGNFNVSFKDLSIPVSGIPITVTRSYDTLRVGEDGDFGPGWHLDIEQMEVEVEHVPGTLEGFGGITPLKRGARVVITTPDGSTEGFTFTPWEETRFFGLISVWHPRFTPDDGVTSSLGVADVELTEVFTDEFVAYGAGGVSYNPQSSVFGNEFTHASFDGKRRTLNATTGEVKRIADHNGNELTFSADAISSNRGRSLTITRDTWGHITKITDPKNQSLTYEYDADGRLTGFKDRRANAEGLPGISYTYHTAIENFEFHLDEIIDPNGNVALKAEYDAQSGRLATVRDALSMESDPPARGATMVYTIDPDTSTYSQSVYAADQDPSSSTEVPMTVAFDSHGNIIRQEMPSGEISVLEYADPASYQPTTQRQVIGQIDSAANGETDDIVTHTEYFAWGGVKTETDSRGNVTKYTYDGSGQLKSTTDALGNSTLYFYDAEAYHDDMGIPVRGNLTFTTDPDNNSTAFQYDGAGNVTKIISGATADTWWYYGGDYWDYYGGEYYYDYYDYYGDDPSLDPASSPYTQPDRSVTEFEYSPEGDLKLTRDPDGNERSIATDGNGNQTGTSFVWTKPGSDPAIQKTVTTSSVPNANDQPESNASAVDGQQQSSSSTEYDIFGRPYRTVDENNLTSETSYDLRGLTIQTRSQTVVPDSPTPVWNFSRTVYDSVGRAEYSTDSVPEGTPVAEIFGSRNYYDDSGRVWKTERLKGVDIQISGAVGKLQASLVGTPTVVSSSETFFDDAGRAWKTIDSFGRISETHYDQYGQAVETRTQTKDENGVELWRVSRSVYDSLGRLVLSTDPFLLPTATALGTGVSPAVHATKTEYDSRGRAKASVRLEGVVVDMQNGQPVVTTAGAELSRTLTEYDEKGRPYKTTAADGQTSITLYDARGRAEATLGHAVPAASVGLSGIDFDGKDVRLRTQSEFDQYGQIYRRRDFQIQVVDAAGDPVGDPIITFERVTEFEFDEKGQVVKTIHADGATTESEYDLLGRVTAEIDPLGRRREMEYDGEGRLAAVTLPPVANPSNPSQMLRPRYEYGYDATGQMQSIIDNLAVDPAGQVVSDHDGTTGDDSRTTSFQFDSRGQQRFRTLPEGNTEEFRYDDRGRQYLHVSFEGIVRETKFDDSPGGGGRTASVRHFDDLTAYNNGAGTPAEIVSYAYDALGRQISVSHDRGSGNVDVFTTAYDAQGRVVRETSPSGNVNYAYDALGRRTRVFTGYGADYAADDAAPLSDVRYGYDDLGRLSSVETVVRDSEIVDIDEAQTGAQPEPTAYHYDLLGRMDYTELPGGVVEDYSFDSMDRLLRMRQLHSDADNSDRSDNLPRAVFEYGYDPDRDPATTGPTDGKRYSLQESFFFDHDANPTTADDERVTNYTWDYDDAGRLTNEAITHFDSSLDRTESFVMDLVGNRLSRDVDYVSASAVDQVFQYEYDGNDRLLSETRDDSDTGAGVDQTTTYDWGVVGTDPDGGTQQLGKTVTDSAGAVISKQLFAYNLQGRMAAVVNETHAGGAATSRSRVQYEYNPEGIRITASEASDADLNGAFDSSEQGNTTEYLIDAHNHTGYAQTIVETTKNDAGQTIKRISYTFGADEITQTVSDIDPATGSITSTETHTFGHDGHGSVRVLYAAAAAIAQVYTFAAYGEMLAVHAADGAAVPVTAALTSLGYSGEHFDANAQQQYLRARWYDPANGRFNRLDPFAGNMQDPQSLHKYAYVHGDPIGGVDPTGLFGLAGFSAGFGISSSIANVKNSTDLAVFDAVVTMAQGIQAGQTVEQIFRTFVFNQLIGFGIGFAFGKVIKIGGHLWENGIVIATPTRAALSSAARRPFAIMHNATFRFPRSAAAHAPRPAPAALPIRSRMSRFNSTQLPRVQEWDDWARRQQGVTARRLDQAQVNAQGQKISGNRPDYQFTLEGGHSYVLPNGATIDVPAGSTQRVYIELDPLAGGRQTRHARNLLGDDPDGIVVLDSFDADGLSQSITFNPA